VPATIPAAASCAKPSPRPRRNSVAEDRTARLCAGQTQGSPPGCGVSERQQLPNDDEIDAAVRAYREVFQADTHS
jgi:hypothetical protein